jgi:hypothetical protein
MSLHPEETPPVPEGTRRVARVPPVGRALQHKTLHGSSPSDCKRIMRRSRPLATARRPPSAKLSTSYGQGWRAVSRKAYDVLISAGVGI